jgi:hypothetical protein
MPLLEHGSQQERLTVLDVVTRIGDSATIAPVLDLAVHFSPAERRRVEQLVVNMCLRSVPAIVEVLNGENNSYPSRSIAARALGKLAFPQFEAQSAAIIRRELMRASDYMYFSWQLGASDSGGRGTAVLRRYYEDAYRSVLDFVLELLTIGGRLPNFELIGSSLRSGNQKARRNAIETLEQGVSRPVFKLLLPLVDSRGMDDRISCYLRSLEKNAPSPKSSVPRP